MASRPKKIVTSVTAWKEDLIRDIAMRKLEKIFHDKKYQELLERMLTSKAFDMWVEMTAKEVSVLNKQGLSRRAILHFLDETARGYANTYLKAVSMQPGFK